MFGLDSRYMAESFGTDHLTFELGDPGSIDASFLAKVPGPAMELGEAHMRFRYADAFDGAQSWLEAYERLIHDVMMGDHTLFTTADGIERLWEISEPVLESPPPLRSYKPDSWGPKESDDLIAPRRWHLPGHRV
jgi:glucose-6-phosphate 1-dehydrogenase